MCNHQRLSGRMISTVRIRGFSSLPAARWVILLAIIGLLCGGLLTAPYAVGSESEGQQTDSDPYEKMREQTFSEEQWLKMLRERVHQPVAIWQGMEPGLIEADSTSMSISGLQFAGSASAVLEYQLATNGLVAKHPLMFLPLFDDRDPETVLTGIMAYRQAMTMGEFKPEDLGKEKVDQVVGAIREKLLPHRDVRVRWMAIETLGGNRWLTPEDFEQGLNDFADVIRASTAFWLQMMMGEWSWQADPDNQDGSGSRLTKEQFQERYSRLADILLNHLNDTHFYIREAAATNVRSIFIRRFNENQDAKPDQEAPALPEDFDWVRSSWQARREAQEAWKQWWVEHGAVATP